MIEFFRNHYARRDLAARAWRADGGRVLGTIGEGLPRALAAAAGFLPVRLSGNPALPLRLVKRHLHASSNKEQSARPIRLPWVDSIIEQLLDGSCDFATHLVVPYTRKEVAQAWTKLRDLERDWPQLRFPPRFLLDHAPLGGERAAAYNAARIDELRAQLESWSGQAITPRALAGAEALEAEGAALLARLQALRGERIGGADALAIIATSRWLPRAVHNEALRTLLAGGLPAVRGRRVFVAGSAPDDTTLYRAIEAAGGQVTGENHDWGQRLFEADCPPVLVHPQAASVARCLARARACKAEAAIHWVQADDAFALWDVPAEQAALRAAGIPCLYLAQQPYAPDGAAIAAQARDFLGGLP